MMSIDEFFAPADGFVVPAQLDLGPSIYVHFDNAYVEALGVASSGPAATCKSADVETAEQGVSVLAVDSVDYRVQGIEPDGTGVTVLRLHRAT